MTVRKLEKKVLRPQSQPDTVDLSPELKQIRELIKTLPTDDEGEDMNAAEATEEKTSSVRKKKKSKPAKESKKAKTNGAEGTSLADICKGLKIEPRSARRILRNSDDAPSVDGNRWTWTKASDVARVKKILSDAYAE